MTTQKKNEKELVLIIEIRYEIKHLDYLSSLADAIEELRGSGAVEIIDARVEEK